MMNLSWLKNKKIHRALLLGIAAVFALLLIGKVVVFVANPYLDLKLINAALAENRADPAQTAKQTEKSKALVAELKQKNPFQTLSALAKLSPPTVNGLLGDKALINGQWYKVGQTAAGAKILAVEAKQAKIVWEGKTMTLPVIAAPSPSDPGKPGGPSAPPGFMPPGTSGPTPSGPPGPTPSGPPGSTPQALPVR